MNDFLPQRLQGFTLLETIIYIGLFSTLFTGIIGSVYPLFTSAGLQNKQITTQTETAFILEKIEYIISESNTTPASVVVIPSPGQSSSTLILTTSSADTYQFMIDTAPLGCLAPRLCSPLSLKKNSGPLLALTSTRVVIENFIVTHTPPDPILKQRRFIDVSFVISGTLVGPVRYYLRF